MVRPESLTPAQAALGIHAMSRCDVGWDLFDAVAREVPPYWLGEVKAPTLVAWPEHDRILPVRTCSRPFRELISAAEWRELPGVGHLPMGDDPVMVARTIADWTAAHTRKQVTPA